MGRNVVMAREANPSIDSLNRKKTAETACAGQTTAFRRVAFPSNCRAGIKRGGLPHRSSRLLPLLLGLVLLVPGLGLAQTETKLTASNAGGTVIATWEVSR